MMQEPHRLGSGTHWEDKVGYSRAIRVGNIVEVSGTTAVNNGQPMFPYDAFRQTQYILLRIEEILADLGCQMSDVVRTRIYVANIYDWEHIGRAHLEVFQHHRPASTMVEVCSLIQPELVVEIEATAIVQDNGS